jgi:hypothetical protein
MWIACCSSHLREYMALFSVSALTDPQCRFALSADDRLEPTGVNSHIDYRRDYYMYLEYLENGLALGKEPVIDLINDWNNKFFRHLAAARQAGGSTSEEHDDIMSQLARSREIGEEEPEQG